MGYTSYHENLERDQEEQEASIMYDSAAQAWLHSIPIMQQSVLFSAIRAPDGMAKDHPAKDVIRWYRRCVLISAFDGKTLDNPYDKGGGSFTGPSLKVHDFGQACTPRKQLFDSRNNRWVPLDKWYTAMGGISDAFIKARDEMTLHYYAHAMHAFQILGVSHPNERIREYWQNMYLRMVDALHLSPEPVEALQRRLGDSESQWKEREDPAGSCST